MKEYRSDLTENCLKFAEDDIGETEDIRQESLDLLKAWLDENPEINANPDPKSLLYFLRACKFDIERTKEKIKGFYKLRFHRSEWFKDRYPFNPTLVELFKIGPFLPLKEKDAENRQILIIRPGAHNPKKHKFSDVLKASQMIFDYLMFMDESISVYGINIYFDMNQLSVGHALQLTPIVLKHMVESMVVYPIRFKLLKFLMVPGFVRWTLNIFRSFLPAKLKSRMFISSETAEDPSLLPIELGGNSESYEELAKYWHEKMESNADYFDHVDQYKTIC